MKQKIILVVVGLVVGYIAHAEIAALRNARFCADAEAHIRDSVKVGDDATQVDSALKKLRLDFRYDEQGHRFYGLVPRPHAYPSFFVELDATGKVTAVKVYFPIII